MSLEAFAHPEATTFFSEGQKLKAVMVNSGARKTVDLARKHKVLLISGGDMFSDAYQHRQADNIIAIATMGEFSTAPLAQFEAAALAIVASQDGGSNNRSVIWLAPMNTGDDED